MTNLSTLGMQAPSPSWEHRAHRALTYSLALLMPGPVLSPGRRLGSDPVEGHSADSEAGERDSYREAGKPVLKVNSQVCWKRVGESGEAPRRVSIPPGMPRSISGRP